MVKVIRGVEVIKVVEVICVVEVVRVVEAHFSKWPTDFEINGTQEIVTFSDPAFHGLPFGVLHFTVSVSFKTIK